MNTNPKDNKNRKLCGRCNDVAIARVKDYYVCKKHLDIAVANGLRPSRYLEAK